jgi:hypothetical protein
MLKILMQDSTKKDIIREQRLMIKQVLMVIRNISIFE